MKWIAFLCLFVASAAHAQWEKKDTALLGGALGLLVIDWGQTRDLAKSHEYVTPACKDPSTRRFVEPCEQAPLYREFNPFLPAYPSTADVDRYFAIAVLGTAGLAYVLPTSYRRPFLGTVIVLESLVILHNHSIGLRFSY